MITISNS